MNELRNAMEGKWPENAFQTKEIVGRTQGLWWKKCEKIVKRQPAESLPLILKRTTSYAADLEICNELILDNIVLAQQLFLDD